MNTSEASGPGRRDFIRLGGLGAAGAAFLAACSKKVPPKPQQTGDIPTTNPNVAPATVAVAPPSKTDEQDDLASLRTATSLEFALANGYQLLATNSNATTDFKAVATRLQAQHSAAAKTFQTATSDRLAELKQGSHKELYAKLTDDQVVYQPGKIKDEKAKTDDNGNAYVWDNFVLTRIAAISDAKGVWQLALAFERTAAGTEVLNAGSLSTASLRATAMKVGAAQARAAAYLALQITPDDPASAAPYSAFYTRDAIGAAALLTYDGNPPAKAAG